MAFFRQCYTPWSSLLLELPGRKILYFWRLVLAAWQVLVGQVDSTFMLGRWHPGRQASELQRLPSLRCKPLSCHLFFPWLQVIFTMEGKITISHPETVTQALSQSTQQMARSTCSQKQQTSRAVSRKLKCVCPIAGGMASDAFCAQLHQA